MSRYQLTSLSFGSRIIDDSAGTRLVVSARLKKHGDDRVFAADASQGISVAKEWPGAIVLDFAKLQETQSFVRCSGVNGRNCHECGEGVFMITGPVDMQKRASQTRG